MKKKNLLILLGIIILIIIIAILGFYFFSKQDLCNKINNEIFKQNCLLCETSEDPIYCKDSVYIDFAFLKEDSSLCRNVIKEYMKSRCELNIKSSEIRDDAPLKSVPNDEILESGGYRKVS